MSITPVLFMQHGIMNALFLDIEKGVKKWLLN
jgi:hypothetical protein